MTVSFVINNNDATAAAGKTFDRIDPVTGDVASTAAAAGPADVATVTAAANAAFAGWAATGPAERRALLNKAADIMDAKADAFIATMIAETGSTGPWAGFNVMFASGIIREAAAMTTQIGG
ncbi:MAG: aldehyde dehydrogenase family protein, partial [Maritimibacter sp.]